MKKMIIISFSVLFCLHSNAQNVGIGTTTPQGKLNIKGNADTSQLVIDANSTQSNTRPLIRLRNAAGIDLLHIHSDNPNNTFIGLNAGRVNDAGAIIYGIFNTFIGSRAGYSNTYGNQNTANGNQALFANTTGNNNTANGSYTLYSNRAGNNATAIGSNAMAYTNSQITPFTNANVAVGYEALRGSTDPSANTGNDNTALGYQTLRNNIFGDYNTATGYQALYNNSSGGTGGNHNTANGYQALYNITGGNNNIAVGANSGPNSITYGSINNSITVGYNQPNNLSNQAVIGNTSTQWVGGYVGWTTYISDGRFKKNVRENVKGLDFIMQLRPVTYNLDIRGLNKVLGVDNLVEKTNKPLKEKAGTGLKHVEINNSFEKGIAQKENITYSGFIAQEVEQVAKKTGYNFSGVKKPQNENNNYGITYSDFVVPLVKAVQEQQLLIENLTRQVEQSKISGIVANQQELINQQTKNIEMLMLENRDLKIKIDNDAIEIKKQLNELKKQLKELTNKN